MTILDSQINTHADSARKIAELEALVAKLKAGRGNGRLTLKVSKAGALSVYAWAAGRSRSIAANGKGC